MHSGWKSSKKKSHFTILRAKRATFFALNFRAKNHWNCKMRLFRWLLPTVFYTSNSQWVKIIRKSLILQYCFSLNFSRKKSSKLGEWDFLGNFNPLCVTLASHTITVGNYHLSLSKLYFEISRQKSSKLKNETFWWF